jgi:hypothetical protein
LQSKKIFQDLGYKVHTRYEQIFHYQFVSIDHILYLDKVHLKNNQHLNYIINLFAIIIYNIQHCLLESLISFLIEFFNGTNKSTFKQLLQNQGSVEASELVDCFDSVSVIP